MIEEEKYFNPHYSKTETKQLNVSDDEWKKILPKNIYYVARCKGTEYPFKGKYWNYTGVGTYHCVACGNALFHSDARLQSSCGWPSFFDTIRKDSVQYKPDNTYGMRRTEVLCGRCDSHLGHVFEDWTETRKYFCLNSIVLDFLPD